MIQSQGGENEKTKRYRLEDSSNRSYMYYSARDIRSIAGNKWNSIKDSVSDNSRISRVDTTTDEGKINGKNKNEK